MLVVTVDLVPGGYEPLRRTIGSMRVVNVSNLAHVSDYSVDVMEDANPLTGNPPCKAACTVLAHDRRQSVWTLLAKASEEIMKADFVEL
ncbi:hypothetical protein V1281_006412 [Nitrobacteraceae bacterium AZCC 2161]